MSATGQPSASDILAMIDLNKTIGALLVGGLFSAILYGITITQTVVFYQREHSDHLLVKAVVASLWMLDTFDMGLLFHILYWYLIKNYMNPFSLTEPVWSIIMHVMITSITQAVVRGMFTLRVWKLSNGNRIICLLITLMSLFDLTLSTIITVKAFHTTFVGLKKLEVLVYLEFSAALLGDLLVAVCLCYLLHRSRTGFGRTESIINILTVYIVNTGMLTAIVSTVSLTLYATQTDNYIYVAVYLQLSKLYVNAYLAMLNARESIRDRSEEVHSIHLSQLSHGRSGAGISAVSSARTHDLDKDQLAIMVETQVDTADDYQKRKHHAV